MKILNKGVLWQIEIDKTWAHKTSCRISILWTTTPRFETRKNLRTQTTDMYKCVENRSSHKYELHFHPWISNVLFSTRIPHIIWLIFHSFFSVYFKRNLSVANQTKGCMYLIYNFDGLQNQLRPIEWCHYIFLNFASHFICFRMFFTWAPYLINAQIFQIPFKGMNWTDLNWNSSQERDFEWTFCDSSKYLNIYCASTFAMRLSQAPIKRLLKIH